VDVFQTSISPDLDHLEMKEKGIGALFGKTCRGELLFQEQRVIRSPTGFETPIWLL
jgi:hypothetical protein